MNTSDDKKKKKMTTSKKQKFIRSTVLYNESGEPIPFQEIQVEDRDFNFHKVWLEHLLSSFDCIANKKLKLAFWIVEHLNKENQLVMTQRRIAEESGISYKTVTDTMRDLQHCDPPFLVKINSGAYRVNPDIIWKGSHNSRMGVVYNYSTDVIRAQQTTKKDNTVTAGANVADPATAPEDITTETA